MASISARSRAIWRSNSSRWLCIEMYSPAAMLNAPASRPATPARRMKLGLPDAAPATPMTSDRLLTSPSLTPKMIARSVPDRPDRCHCSRWPISAALAASRAIATPSRGVAAPRSAAPALVGPALEPLPDLGVLALVGGDRGGLRGTALRVVGVLLVALERLDQLGDGGRPEQARGQDDEPDAHPRPAGRRHVRAEAGQLGRPDVGMPALVGGDPPERLGSPVGPSRWRPARRTGGSRRARA